ncbi:DUF3427 domain-containing protein [Gordonia crocea]|uniref:DUF3427 domain-containing protein n=1 Tax=Gordonia crocea TaxID=589162 RepID=UPI00137A0C57|nr:DUF3427 domain-containing protein [Gordonia crocea]
MNEPLAPGVYESIHSHRLQQKIDRVSLTPEFSKLAADDAPEVFARHIADNVRRYLSAIRDPAARFAAVNDILAMLPNAADDSVVPSDTPILTSLHDAASPALPRPATPLSDVALLTNTPDEPNMASEIARELGSADRVDLLCAFIRFAGVAVISRELLALRDRNVPLRVVTTTYRGATERRAVDDLVNKYGAEVRVRYETASTRLHAKAWLFRRDSGFDTGYVGSSNLSRSAMVDGLEWNVRISGVATPALTRKFEATFDTYWDDPAFKPYNPATDAELLDHALAEAGGGNSARETITISGLEVRPYPHQERMLEALDVARVVHNRHRNLLVAATGTGKTVVAALDYRRLCGEANESLSLLFVAHRKEILEQSLRKYREVLGDGSFGELYVDGRRPVEGKHVFASVQSLARAGKDLVTRSTFDVVVIDEFHHAAAATYRSLLEEADAQELLGLTATPERSDGADILRWFGGRSTYELRLWAALEQDLLCPFHYYGVADNTDLSGLAWSRGDYSITELENVYTGNDARTRVVLNTLRDRVADPAQMRALGFCVSIGHARYMAQAFSNQGIPSIAIDAHTPSADRAQAFTDLRRGSVKCLFAVDIFNEGVDIPDVDTLLMLRPTQSATVFLQQLGRGLRRSQGKSILTVLDFIGHQRAEFNFAPRFTSLTGKVGHALIDEIDNGFPFLPGASRIVLDRQAQETVVESVRRQLPTSRRSALVQDIQRVGTTELAVYLDHTRGELSDIYGGSSPRSWTPLIRDAGLDATAGGVQEDALLKRVRSLAHVDDPERIATYSLLASSDCSTYARLTVRQQAYARMLFTTLWPDNGGFDSYDAGLDVLRANPAVCSEIRQLLAICSARIPHVPKSVPGIGDDCPLYSHAHYRREEVLAAIGFATLQRKARGQAGGSIASDNFEALFVNLHKDEGEFSPTTMYRDYPISRQLFHWESPNNTMAASDRGQRYLAQPVNGVDVLLFVRDRPNGDYGSEPFIFLGPVDYVEHRGERPIGITWKLRRDMPAAVFTSGSVVAV